MRHSAQQVAVHQCGERERERVLGSVLTLLLRDLHGEESRRKCALASRHHTRQMVRWTGADQEKTGIPGERTRSENLCLCVNPFFPGPPPSSQRPGMDEWHTVSNITRSDRFTTLAHGHEVNWNTLPTISRPVGICHAKSAMLTAFSAMCAERAVSLPFCI